MIFRDRVKQQSYHRHAIMKKVGKDASAEELMDYLLGNPCDGYHGGPYYLYRYAPHTDSIGQRLNKLWVYPLVLVSLPFQWLIKGSVGIKRETRLGQILVYLIGNL